MNDKNFEYLKDNVKYMGFGDGLYEAISKNLEAGKDSFLISYKSEINKKPFEAMLQFKKSTETDMYFFNSYQASLEKNNGEKLAQTFYLNKGKGVTAKEAFNLLEGRAVYKELTNKAGENYQAWVQLDFNNKDKHNNHETKQYHENYGYDLKAAINKYPVQEMDNQEKGKALLQSLQKGNIQSVTMEMDGKEQRMFIEANPQYKMVNVYDEHMKRLQKETVEQVMKQQPVDQTTTKQDQSKTEKKTEKQATNKVDNTNNQKKKNRKSTSIRQ